MLPIPAPDAERPKAAGRYFTKYTAMTVMAALKANPEPKPTSKIKGLFLENNGDVATSGNNHDEMH